MKRITVRNEFHNTEVEEEKFQYLDTLRESGVTNMFGAVPFLQKTFGIEKREATAVLTKWMSTFSERHQS